jgi:hypothetical protein
MAASYGTSPLSSVKTRPSPCKVLPAIASLEWEMVHSREDAIRWHMKWTPWFSPEMIGGLVDYGYAEAEKKNIAPPPEKDK